MNDKNSTFVGRDFYFKSLRGHNKRRISTIDFFSCDDDNMINGYGRFITICHHTESERWRLIGDFSSLYMDIAKPFTCALQAQ
jgi:hypothetical protein